DLVLHGRITTAQAHLRPDETIVVTDYLIAPLRVVKQHQHPPIRTPGGAMPIILRLPGGHLKEDGLRLSTTVNAYPESESFKAGEDVIVFLVFDREAAVYRLAGGPFGGFRILSGRVH